MWVFNTVEILGVSKGIWSVKNLRLTDGERQYERTCRPNLYLVVQQVHPLPSGPECVKKEETEVKKEQRRTGGETNTRHKKLYE